MEKKDKQLTIWRVVAIVAVILLIIMTCLYGFSFRRMGSPAPEETLTATSVGQIEEKPAEDIVTAQTEPLASWTDSSATKQQLIPYMEAITDEASADFIPVERRVAVFDLDGTLFGETNPIYFDHSLLLYRVLEDPDYKDKASDFEKETCYQILEGIRAGEYPEGMDMMHGQAVASAFAGMTVDEFVDYCIEFGKQEAPGYDNLTRGDSFYKPMLEVIDYLQENDFSVYVVSGTDRLILRGICKDKLNLPFSQIIGSDESIVATGQGDSDGLDYVLTDSDKLVLGGDFIIKNLKMNKVGVIAQEIGVQPVLAFGNSSGDASMGEYVTSNNEYRSMAFMLCCDDLDREYGSESKARKMQESCDKHGWTAISMKNDWKTIYGENVTRNPDKGLDFYYDYEIPENRAGAGLPAYEYPGPEAFYSVLYKYLVDEFGSHYSNYEVCIPCPVIMEVDDSDKSDIKVYGDFWVFNYNLEGDTLMNVSGGAYPGVMHLKNVDTAEGFEVTNMEVVADGSNFTPSAKKIFGEKYDDFMKIESDTENREAIRAQIIANYVFDKGLDITRYQDYGWDPVILPEQNIDAWDQTDKGNG